MTMGIFRSNKTNIEIERKFLVSTSPTKKPERCHKIRQGYVAREGGNVVRIRQIDDRYILSVKTPQKGIGRYEVERDITADEAEVLFMACALPPLEKRRDIHRVGNHIWEVDYFGGVNKGLIIAEIELSSEKEKFDLPSWVGPEVTGYQKFYNASIVANPFKNWGVTYEDLVARMTS